MKDISMGYGFFDIICMYRFYCTNFIERHYNVVTVDKRNVLYLSVFILGGIIIEGAS